MMDKYEKDPIGLAISEEYTSIVIEGVDWLMQWGTKHTSCALNKKYAKRFEMIQDRGVKKQRELGLKN